jgi:O-antigen/teichoic acid export membrane protein
VSDLREKLLRGSLIRVLNPLLNIVVAFFMIPFVIHYIGEHWYGLWLLVASFVGYYGFLDLGISTANERFISRALGKKNNIEINRIFNNSIFCLTIAGIISLVISFIIAFVCTKFVDDPSKIRTFRIVILITGFGVSLSFPMRAFFGFLNANIRYDFVNSLSMLKVLIRTLLIVYFLKMRVWNNSSLSYYFMFRFTTVFSNHIVCSEMLYQHNNPAFLLFNGKNTAIGKL